MDNSDMNDIIVPGFMASHFGRLKDTATHTRKTQIYKDGTQVQCHDLWMDVSGKRTHNYILIISFVHSINPDDIPPNGRYISSIILIPPLSTRFVHTYLPQRCRNPANLNVGLFLNANDVPPFIWAL